MDYTIVIRTRFLELLEWNNTELNWRKSRFNTRILFWNKDLKMKKGFFGICAQSMV